jgi:hypothetical protein
MHNDKQAVPEALAKIEKALKTVAGLADGSIEFTMRVPAVPDQDTDLILADAHLTARALLSAAQPVQGGQAEEINRLRAEVVNRNQRALEGDKAVAVRESLLDRIEELERQLSAPLQPDAAAPRFLAPLARFLKEAQFKRKTDEDAATTYVKLIEAATSAQEPVAVVGGQPVAWIRNWSLGPRLRNSILGIPSFDRKNWKPLYAAPADSAKNQNHVAASVSLSGEQHGLSGAAQMGQCGEPQQSRPKIINGGTPCGPSSAAMKIVDDWLRSMLGGVEADNMGKQEYQALVRLVEFARSADSDIPSGDAAMPLATAMARIGELLGLDEDADPADIIEELESRFADSASPSAAIQGKDSDATEGVSAKEQVLAVYKRAYSLPCAGGWVIYEFGKPDVKLGTGKDESEAWEAAALKVNESAAQGRKEQ